MKTILRIILVQVICLPLFITEAMARDEGKKSGRGGGSASRAKVDRPSIRSSKSDSRNPITSSRISKPTSRPSVKPTARPAPKPTERPAPKPTARPAPKPSPPPGTKPKLPPKRPEAKPNLPSNRPQTKPTSRPQTKPAPRPEAKPAQRPETKPGNVSYPRPNRPKPLPGSGNRPDANKPGNNRPGDVDRPGVNRPNKKPIVRPGQNSKPIKKPNFESNKVNVNSGNKTKNWWQSNKTTVNKVNVFNNTNIRGGDTTIKINNNFKNNVNWSTNRNHWGYNPWWNRPATRPWYGGSWNCGWNNHYYHHHHRPYWGGYRPLPGYSVHYHYDDDDNDVAQAIGWGLVGWGLGKLIFDSGYQTYSNPYPAQPVPSSRGTQVTYTQPITVVAAQTAPAESEEEKVSEQSESYMAQSHAAFKQRDYLVALEFANKAIGEAPGDGALHEYRALVLFALGKFSEAAGVLNPVLAGSPGWDWTTMIGLYDSQESYLKQFESLQDYCAAKPDAADAQFLLGYHYMVCGHLEDAAAAFENASRLQPADSVSAQLRDLAKASSNNGDTEDDVTEEEPSAEETTPTPVPLEKLEGTWVSDKGAQGTVTLAFKEDGKFIWTFKKDSATNDFSGEFSMNDDGLLVLDAEDSQMVASVELPQDDQMKFVLSGGPPGDPGLLFVKK